MNIPNAIISPEEELAILRQEVHDFAFARRESTELCQQLSECRAREAALKAAIQNALSWANGHQGDWGDRAITAFEFLENANDPGGSGFLNAVRALRDAVKAIYAPFPHDSEFANPCKFPSPPEGREIARTLAAIEPFIGAAPENHENLPDEKQHPRQRRRQDSRANY